MTRTLAIAATIAVVAAGAVAWTWRRPVQWQGGWL